MFKTRTDSFSTDLVLESSGTLLVVFPDVPPSLHGWSDLDVGSVSQVVTELAAIPALNHATE